MRAQPTFRVRTTPYNISGKKKTVINTSAHCIKLKSNKEYGVVSRACNRLIAKQKEEML